MPPTTNFKRGDVVLVPFPFTDLSASKQRPAVIVSSDSFNSQRFDVILVAITSNVPLILAEDEIAISSPDFRSSGLLKASIVKTGKLITIHQALIRKKIGILPSLILNQILYHLRKQFET